MTYAKATEQLVVEIHVRDLERSIRFYESFGFKVVQRQGHFCVLGWESNQLFLEEVSGLPPEPVRPPVNVRVMVPDVDRFWELARKNGARVVAPIEDRYYGLRDFTITDPDGIGVRFGTWLRRS